MGNVIGKRSGQATAVVAEQPPQPDPPGDKPSDPPRPGAAAASEATGEVKQPDGKPAPVEKSSGMRLLVEAPLK